ncbi:hypothetical protein NDU88_005377 [Pleurodeles waltl]|uniref:Uncharacterized protein n=1 Tax=Pleurodeles waltl TaxID=8319 RepID=A0AAV7SLM5_PLEWA|nr:hypothetical protein NDU88_005377 [Pleurodeles waltl]
MGVPTWGASRKEEYQKRALAEACLQENVEVEEPENGPSEELPPAVGDVTPRIVPPGKQESSASSHGLAAQERRENREFQLQLARQRLEEKKAEREAEAKQPEAERALAEKKLLLAHELSLK